MFSLENQTMQCSSTIQWAKRSRHRNVDKEILSLMIGEKRLTFVNLEEVVYIR